MTHTARKKGESGFYHVVTKGDGGQIIFECERDRRVYLRMLKDTLADHKAQLHAYCLMGNHVHLLLRDEDDELSAFMKQLDERYAMFFTKTTGRVGHVFQYRFWSEPIECDEHYLATIRYIHANPEHACICESASYPWSSYKAYIGFDTGIPVTCDFALEILGGVEAFALFQESGGKYVVPFPGSKLKNHLGVDELANVAIELLGHEMLNGLKALKPSERLPHFELLKQAGFTCVEIARVSGIGASSVFHTLKAA